MSGSQFEFLKADFPDEFEEVRFAERRVLEDPRGAVERARVVIEICLNWAYEHDTELVYPYDNKLAELINTPTLRSTAGEHIVNAANKIRQAGNKAAHRRNPPTKQQAVTIMSALFTFCFWYAHTYGQNKPDPNIRFNPHDLPRPAEKIVATSLKQLREEQAARKADTEEIAKLKAALAEKDQQLETEKLAAERAKTAANKAQAKKQPATSFDYDETQTRQWLIDALLKEAGWDPTAPNTAEYPVTGMPNKSGKGYVDYVLWGDDGKPLAVVEAKRARTSDQKGREQAKRYADCLETETGQRPIIFWTNGYTHHIWDDTSYPPRQVAGFYTKDQLELAIQRRTTRKPLRDVATNTNIAGGRRPYQEAAIKAISERFEDENQREALLVMATGSGKTRTVIGLADRMLRAGWAKRVLFLADRNALVTQAINAFKQHLPDSSPVNLVTERNEESRVYACTYQSMINIIDEKDANGVRRFGPGHFDLIVVDEAHRSIYKKYGAIFDYFDSFLVGLTATPKDDVHKNTYELFGLTSGVPTYAYSLDQAVNDKFLVPRRDVSVPLKFPRHGIKYDELSDEDKELWEETDWDPEDYEAGKPPTEVDSNAVNKWLFNTDTVDKVLDYLITQGIKVGGGDRVGKSIIFAKNQKHADFIQQRYDRQYAKGAGHVARTITHNVAGAQGLIESFERPDAPPDIVISVDMMDTGIDIPPCVNLVLFKRVRSKTKFWQMLGRGTRLCPDLFGPGQAKTHFNVFDFCENFEYFSQDKIPAEPADAPSLSERLFTQRLDLIELFDAAPSGSNTDDADQRQQVATRLQEQIASMNPDNFQVRRKLRLVEKYRESAAWNKISIGELGELRENVANLPDELPAEHELAKRFDVINLNAQLAVLRGNPYNRQQTRMREIAAALETHSAAIPKVAEEMALLRDMQTDEWWEAATHTTLEDMRNRVRELVHVLPSIERKIVYTNFDDEIGEGETVDMTNSPHGFGDDHFEQFRKKAQAFLKDIQGEGPVAKIRSGAPVTMADIDELQRLLVAADVGGTDDFETASERAGNFGLFIRSLVGLDRGAAKRAFGDFLDDKAYTKNQIEFVDMIINYLTENGTLQLGRLYESPFKSVAPTGPEGLFLEAQSDRLFVVIEELNDLKLL